MAPTQAAVIGVDLGTTSCKAGIFALDGELLGHGTADCSVSRPQPGWVEQNPEDYWGSARAAIHDALSSAGSTQPLGLACCGHTPSLVFLDAAGYSIRPAIIWQDSRAAQEADALEAQIPADTWAAWLGMNLPRNASYPPARLRWLQEHEPDTLRRTHTLLQPKDYLNYRLTGRVASDHWSNKGLAHLQTGEPIQTYHDLLGIDPAIAPASLYPHHELAGLTPDAARQLELPAGLPVAVGWSDAMCGMLGTGALASSGMAFDIAGTSDIIGLTADHQPTMAGGVLAAPVLDGNLHIIYGPTQTSGGAISWFLERFWPELDAHALDDAAAPSSDGLVFLPYLEGERTPIWDAKARGVFFGASLAHTRAHFLRAVLEGVAFSIRHVLERAEDASGVSVGSVRVSGGGGQSALWNQIKADVLGRTMLPTAIRDAGILGAAMLAGMAANVWSDIEAASAAMVRTGPPVEPDASARAAYERSYQVYRALYLRLRDLF